MSYMYWLPDEQGQKKDYTTENNAIMIIGANGSGKSKLGAWIEQQNLQGVHRVGAQRNLTFQENIPLKSYSEAQNWVFFGSADGKDSEKRQRWNWGHFILDTLSNIIVSPACTERNSLSSSLRPCNIEPLKVS